MTTRALTLALADLSAAVDTRDADYIHQLAEDPSELARVLREIADQHYPEGGESCPS